MATVTDPSAFFLTMRTMGNAMTLALRNESFHIRRKAAPSYFSSEAVLNIDQTFFATLEDFQNMTEEEKALLDEAALNYYTSAFSLLLSLGFKAFLSSYLGAGELDCLMLGGYVE